MSKFPAGGTLLIRDVWDSNLDEEMDFIRSIVDDYPILAMDTEFPGVVVRPVGKFSSPAEYHYQSLRENVNLLKLIQLGLTFCDEDGNLPRCETGEFCVWQFNMKDFNVEMDVYAPDSIDLLKQSGIDFQKFKDKGVEATKLGALLMSSGLVLNEDVRWITFHSGYDFGYLLKMLTSQRLPVTETEFFRLLNLYFPVFFDIKFMMKSCDSLHGGLNRLAETLGVKRFGPSHQAGSDSQLTSATFRVLVERYFSSDLRKFKGILFGLGRDGNGNSYLNMNLVDAVVPEDGATIAN